MHRVCLPQQVCFCHRYQCKNTADAANKLRDTYISAARTGMMSMAARMFTMRMDNTYKGLDLMCCIPVNDEFSGAEREEFASTPALCIYYRGPYEGIGTAIAALSAYVQQNQVETTGYYRCIYLEGPPSRGKTVMIILHRSLYQFKIVKFFKCCFCILTSQVYCYKLALG